MRRPNPRKIREELASTFTHGLGAVLSVVGMAWLVMQSLRYGDALDQIGTGVFGLTLIILYTASMLYHGAHRRQLRRLFLRCDYAGIFLLIAGTYTAVLLLNLRDTTGWSTLAVVWALCLAGVVLTMKFRFPGHYRLAATLVYVALGWLVVAVVKPLAAAAPGFSLQLILAGGFFYTVGVVFFLWQRLPYHHAIWHLFVLAGSACHWWAVLDAVSPAGG